MMKPFFYLTVIGLLAACQTEVTEPLVSAMQSSHPAIVRVAYETDVYEVQILYTQIDTTETGEIQFTDHTFQLNNDHYFYPASTVKLPAAVLALEYSDTEARINSDTPYTIARDSLIHNINDDVRQIFAVSDNEANNRLYELLGRHNINWGLTAKGIEPVRIAHRLSTPNAAAIERSELSFMELSDTIKIGGGMDAPIEAVTLQRQQKGKGFMRNDSLIQSPMDFSEKNYFPLSAQHKLMKRLFFPEKFQVTERFRISEKNKASLFKAMRTVPRLNGYDEREFYDSYGKFFIYGDTKDRIPSEIKIYNKVGYAYGTLTETAYIVDEKANIQFLLSATILVNKNGVFNDDTYEYEEIGIPFMAQLGREIYLYEYSRK